MKNNTGMSKYVNTLLTGEDDKTSLTSIWILYTQTGDPDLFAIVYIASWQMVYSIGYQFFKNKNKAEDLAQDVFLNLMECRDKKTFQTVEKFLAWLRILTMNYCRQQKRRDNKRKLEDVTPDCGTQLVSSDEQIDETVVIWKVIDKALADNTLYKSLINDHVAGYSNPEIAARHGLEEKPTRQRKSRALKLIRTEFARMGMFNWQKTYSRYFLAGK